MRGLRPPRQKKLKGRFGDPATRVPEAGGHRAVFNTDAPDSSLGTITLPRLLVRQLDIPVIAAGGIMDGAGIAAVLHLGAAAAQLGTAFVAS